MVKTLCTDFRWSTVTGKYQRTFVTKNTGSRQHPGPLRKRKDGKLIEKYAFACAKMGHPKQYEVTHPYAS